MSESKTWFVTRPDYGDDIVKSTYWEVLRGGALWFYNQTGGIYNSQTTTIALYAAGEWRQVKEDTD